MPRSAEKCEKVRNEMKERIMKESLRYFALKGFSGTKISELAKYIGIGQGTMYSYFSSKEELFHTITQRIISNDKQELEKLFNAQISPKEKITLLSNSLLSRIFHETGVAEAFALNVQVHIEYGENNYFTENYSKAPNAILARIIEEGQKDGSVIGGDPDMLADFYWSVIHLIALKKVLNNTNLSPKPIQLIRILVKD